jgi:hypothetical protein
MVDRLFNACLKQAIKTHQGEYALCRMERAMQEQNQYIASSYQQLAEHLLTDLSRSQLENSVLTEMISPTKLHLLARQETPATCLVQRNSTNGQLYQRANEGTEKMDKLIKTSAMLRQEVVTPNHMMHQLTTEMMAKSEENDKLKEDTAVLHQENATLKDEVAQLTIKVREVTKLIQKSDDQGTSHPTKENDLLSEARNPTDKKDLVMETPNKAVAMLNKHGDEPTEVLGLVESKLQNDSLVIPQSQLTQPKPELFEEDKGASSDQAKLQAQLEHATSLISEMTLELDKLKTEKAQVEKLLEDEKNQVDKMMYRMQVKLNRAEDYNRSLVAQMNRLKIKFDHELELERTGNTALRNELQELARKLQTKELEEIKRNATRLEAERRSPPIPYQSLQIDPDSGAPPSAPPST